MPFLTLPLGSPLKLLSGFFSAKGVEIDPRFYRRRSLALIIIYRQFASSLLEAYQLFLSDTVVPEPLRSHIFMHHHLH